MNQEPDDVEIVMHLYRLARTGNYQNRRQLLAACKQDFPDVDTAKLKRCMRDLAMRLWRDR